MGKCSEISLFHPLHPPSPLATGSLFSVSVSLGFWCLSLDSTCKWDPPGGGHGNPLQYDCLENPRNRGAWQAAVHGVAKTCTRLCDLVCTHISEIMHLSFPDLFHSAQCPEDHPCYCSCQDFLLVTAETYSIAYIHIFFIHPYFLNTWVASMSWLVYSAAKSTEVHVSFWISVFIAFG